MQHSSRYYICRIWSLNRFNTETILNMDFVSPLTGVVASWCDVRLFRFQVDSACLLTDAVLTKSVWKKALLIGAVTWGYLTSKGRHDYCQFTLHCSFQRCTLFFFWQYKNIYKLTYKLYTFFKVLKNYVHSHENSSDISIKLFTIYMFIYFYNWSTILNCMEKWDERIDASRTTAVPLEGVLKTVYYY